MPASTLVTLLILALASARLTRLVVDDAITLPARAWIVKRFGVESRISELAHCSWCAGVWCSTALVTFAWATGVVDSWAVAVLLVPAVAWASRVFAVMIEE
jgi:hypothetical protein